MTAEKKPKAQFPKKSGRKVLIWALALVALLVVLVLFLVPGFVSSERGRKMILARINESVDGKADFADLSMSWFRGIKVADFSFNDSAGQTSVAIKRIAAKPRYLAILTGSLSFAETVIDEPNVQINLEGRQAKTGRASAQEAPSGKHKAVGLPVERVNLIVNDGSVKVSSPQSETVELSQISSNLKLRPPGQRTDFNIDMMVVNQGGGSKVSARGQVRPKDSRKGWRLEGTSGDLSIEVNDLEIGSLGPILALAAIDIQAKGRISVDIKSEIKDGRLENLSAELEGKNLDVNSVELIGGRFQTSRLDIDAKLTRQQQMINVENLDVRIDWLDARASGTVPTTFGSVADFLKSDSSLSGSFELDVAQALSQMPGILRLKETARVTSGQLTGNIETLTEDGKRKVRAQAELGRLAGVIGSKPVALSEPVTAQLQIASDQAGIMFDKLDLSSSFAKINCSGRTELLKYAGEINLAKLQSELGQFVDTRGYGLAGELSSKGQVSIEANKVAAVGSSVIKGLRLTSPEGLSAAEPMAQIAFSVAAEPSEDILNVDFIDAKADFGQVAIKNAALPLGKKATKPVSLPVSAKVDLEKLQPFAALTGALPKEVQLAGTAESDITVSYENNIYKIATEGTRIENLRVAYPGKEPFEQKQVSVSFDAGVNPADKTIIVSRFQLISPQIEIKKGEFSRVSENSKTKLAGRADCEYDWAAVSAVASAFLPQGLKMEGKRKDTITFASDYPVGNTEQLLANLDTAGKLGFERAEYMGLNFGATEVDVQVQNGLLRIAPFSAAVNNGQLSFAGQADFKKRPALLKTPGPIQIIKDVQINDRTTKKLLTYLNPVFANAVNVSGIANFGCERLAIPLATGTRNDIEVVGTVSIEQLRLQSSDLLAQILSAVGASGSQDITIHPTRFVLQNGFLRYEDMQMDVGDNPVNFKGVIGLDKSLDMTVTLPYTLDGETARVGKKTRGTRVTLPLTGTLDKPQLDLGKLLEQQLKQQLEQKLREGLEELFK
ncbi:MAG: YhdP family protein [Planctomycetota bacterium]